MTQAFPSKLVVLVSWPIFVALGLVLAWLTGRLEVVLVPDSPSYLDYSFESLRSIALEPRTPAYPLWLALWERPFGVAWIPATQVVVHATACWWFFWEMWHWKMPLAQIIVATGAIAVACTAMDHIHTVSTDAMTASIGVMVSVSLMRWARLEGSVGAAVWTVLLAVIALAMRPAYLFLIPWLIVAGALLRRSLNVAWVRAAGSAAILAVATTLPLCGWMTMRWIEVNDFGIVPFGHQNFSGVLIQLVSDEELESLGEMGRAVVEQKQIFLDSGRQFAPGEPGATMTIDARWDDMTYYIAFAAAKRIRNNDPILSHRAMAEMNWAIVSRWPQRYLRWIASAIRRGAWQIAADIVMHPISLPAIGIAMLIVLYRAVSGFRFAASPLNDALSALSIVAITYVVMKVAWVAMTSPPIGRFSDAAAIFLPPLLAAGFVQIWFGDGRACCSSG